MGLLDRLFKSEDMSDIILNCRKCKARYVLGEDAVVASMRQVSADVLASGGRVVGDPSSSPDLVDHGVLTSNPTFRAMHDAQLRLLKKARAKGVKLAWRCAKCEEVQEYPW